MVLAVYSLPCVHQCVLTNSCSLCMAELAQSAGSMVNLLLKQLHMYLIW